MADKIQLTGMLSEGFGIVPKKLMRMKFENLTDARSRNVKLVLCYLLSYSGAGSNVAFPSISRICNDLCLTKPVTIEALKDCQRVGLISKGRLIDKDEKAKQNNIYKLNFIEPKEEKIFTTNDGSKFKIKYFEPPAFDHKTGKESLPVKNINQTGKESLPVLVKNLNPNNNSIIITNNNNKKELPDGQKPDGEEPNKTNFKLIMNYFVEGYYILHNAKMGNFPKEGRAIKEMLKQYSEREINEKAEILKSIIENPKNNYERSFKFLPSTCRSKWNELIDN